MNPIDELIKIFQVEKIEVNDNLMNTTISKIIEFNQIPTYEKISEALSKFNKRDYIEIYLKDESEESITISTDTSNCDKFNDFIKNNEGIESKINLNINIKKSIVSNKISIFNIDKFINNFISYSISDNLKFFNSRFKQKSNIIFINYDNEYMFNTNSIIMTNNDIDITIEQIDRKELLEKCNSVSNFANNIEYALLPEDFSIITTNMNNEFVKRFQEIKILFSLIYIADYSSIDEERLKLKLNGYRNKDYVIQLNNFKYEKKYDEFYKIYRWIFQDSNEYDKIELTRHVISMHCKYSDILDIDEKTFLSIKSNYNIYLKENVDKYIELKNKLTEFIMNTSNQINDVIGNFIGNFEKNIVAFITFILGTIIANVVSDSPLDNILTKDVITIILVILAGSLVYLVITILEAYYRFLSYRKNYYNLKEEYSDILNEEDIDIIFKGDREYIRNKKNIIKIVIIFSILWVVLIFIAFIGIILNYNSEYLKKVIDILYYIIKK